jgi:hypothetical protein
MLGCFVVDEDLEGAALQRREELREIERAERRDRGLPSDDDDDDEDDDARSTTRGGSRRRRRRFRRRGGRDRRWDALEPPKDLVAHGERLATALHDVLLAVRELCSFALEQDGRWSSANNQRKYRVSQLYSSLLDTIRSDVLRDPEHLPKRRRGVHDAVGEGRVRVSAPLVSEFQPRRPTSERRSSAAAHVLLQLPAVPVAPGAHTDGGGALVDRVHAVLLGGRQVPPERAHRAAGR